MIVIADGSGDFMTIQDAIDHIPEYNTEPVIIHIKNGVYHEKLRIVKPFVSLKGEDPERTIITYDDYANKQFPDGEPYHTFNSYSVFIGADDFHAENLTFANISGQGSAVGQAVAAYVDGDRAVFHRCRFMGAQDTLFTGPLPPTPIDRTSFGGPREGLLRRNVRQYYRNCYIEGDVDYIFGSATAVFHKCELFSRKRLMSEDVVLSTSYPQINGWITAASTPEDVAFGYVFLECLLTSEAPPRSVYLGRPWREYAHVAYISCWMGEHIRCEGWDHWEGKPERALTSRFCEYGSRGPGATVEERVIWSYQLDAEEVNAYSVVRVLAGQDGWDPEVGLEGDARE